MKYLIIATDMAGGCEGCLGGPSSVPLPGRVPLDHQRLESQSVHVKAREILVFRCHRPEKKK